MSFRQRHGTIGRGLWPLGVLAVLLLAQALAPSGALGASPAARGGGSATRARAAVGGAPTQVIDAQADPQAAAAAINSGCTDLSNCSWNGSNVTFSYGPRRSTGTCCTTARTRPQSRTPWPTQRPASPRLARSRSASRKACWSRSRWASLALKRPQPSSKPPGAVIVFSQSVTTTTTVSSHRARKGGSRARCSRRRHRRRLHHRWHQPDPGQEPRHELPATVPPVKPGRRQGASHLRHFLPLHDPPTTARTAGRSTALAPSGRRPCRTRSRSPSATPSRSKRLRDPRGRRSSSAAACRGPRHRCPRTRRT